MVSAVIKKILAEAAMEVARHDMLKSFISNVIFGDYTMEPVSMWTVIEEVQTADLYPTSVQEIQLAVFSLMHDGVIQLNERFKLVPRS